MFVFQINYITFLLRLHLNVQGILKKLTQIGIVFKLLLISILKNIVVERCHTVLYGKLMPFKMLVNIGYAVGRRKAFHLCIKGKVILFMYI